MERSYDSTNRPKYNNRSCDMAVGELDTYTGMGMETHGRARDKAQFYFFDTGVRHTRAVKPWITIHGCGTLTWVGEKRTTLGMAVRYGHLWWLAKSR
ncbi:hypothetical protein GOBAR_AA38180 [Gossypium barbadense]|uniref:Uncharacterized protein n=1 Tax=Gossypium barbadense TaxID=3634 RepID=A0A2P5VUM9_GOSBA|nr:hypothetical protein GOBAR_AA38180 [Gossypium barbadense]